MALVRFVFFDRDVNVPKLAAAAGQSAPGFDFECVVFYFLFWAWRLFFDSSSER
jgi:hypothetical protein